MNTLRLSRKRWGKSLLVVAGWLVVLCFAPLVYPNFRSAKIQWLGKDGMQEQSVMWPFLLGASRAPNGPFSLSLDLQLEKLHPRLFSVVADDELLSITVNGVVVNEGRFPILYDPLYPEMLNLSGYLRSGHNSIVFQMRNRGASAGLRISVHPLDPLHVFWALICIAMSCVVLVDLTSGFPSVFGEGGQWIISAGVALRILYFCATPYYLRAHDLGGHVQYLKYVAEHLGLPRPDLGWETHQPPLYYIMGGLWLHVTGQEAGSSWVYGQWQAFSLILSVGCMLVAALIAAALFDGKSGKLQRQIFLVIIAVFPALVFYAGRINNDALFSFISFLWLWLLIKWWDAPSRGRWLGISLLLGAALITKNGALVLTLITCICLIWRTRLIKQVIRSSSVMLICILLVSGWHWIPKIATAAGSSSIVLGNAHLLNEQLRLPGGIQYLLTFNLWEVVRLPFNDPWTDNCRRAFLPEYFFKSALFGEWMWGKALLPAGRLLAVAGLGLQFLFTLGAVISWRQKTLRYTPLVFTTLAICGAQALLVIKEPFACCQDFRFFVVLTVPIATFVAATARHLRGMTLVALALFATASVTFMLVLLYA